MGVFEYEISARLQRFSTWKKIGIMNTRPFSSRRALGLLACTLALASSSYAQTVKILATDPVALEGTSTASFTLVRTGDSSSDLSVNLTISGTASNGVDYVAIASPVTIPAGYLAVDVPIQPILDTVNRGNKTVVLTLDGSSAYTVKGKGYATVKIVDDVFNVAPPEVTLTSPADGSVYTAPASITLSADVDCELPITRVGFYEDDKLLVTLTNAPYTYVWTNVDNGKHTIFARAVDEADKAGVSEVSHVTVSATPVVTVVSLVGNSVFVGQEIPLQAQIGDTNESISTVAFYINGKLAGKVTSAPFIYNWSDVTIGTNSIYAVATDANTSKKGTSPTISVVVVQGNGGS